MNLNGKEYRLYIREFLNQPGHESTACVFMAIEKSTKNDRWPDIICAISDCSRKIELSFDIHSKEARENSIAKIDKLIETMQRFRRALKSECKQMEKTSDDGR